jgi:uncharacterized membrane protein
MPDKLKSGLNKNTAGALSYVLGPLTGVAFLILEKDPFVRFHSVQSIIIFTPLIILQWILGITVFLLPLASLLSILMFILWLVLVYKAWQGEEWEVPVLGSYARKLVKKI